MSAGPELVEEEERGLVLLLLLMSASVAGPSASVCCAPRKRIVEISKGLCRDGCDSWTFIVLALPPGCGQSGEPGAKILVNELADGTVLQCSVDQVYIVIKME